MRRKVGERSPESVHDGAELRGEQVDLRELLVLACNFVAQHCLLLFFLGLGAGKPLTRSLLLVDRIALVLFLHRLFFFELDLLFNLLEGRYHVLAKQLFLLLLVFATLSLRADAVETLHEHARLVH